MENKCKINNCLEKGNLKGFCEKHYQQNYHNENKDKIRIKQKEYYQNNRKKIINNTKQYYKNNRKKVLEYHKEYAKRLEVIKHRKKYMEKNKEIIALKRKEYFNKPEVKKRKERYMKKYKIENKEKIRKTALRYGHKRFDTDINYRIKVTFSNRIRHALSNNYKRTSSIKLIGCSVIYLKAYLEEQFKKGMSWDNYGQKGWHIDHIKPLCLFDLTKEEEQLKAFNYKNLQPLWWKENLTKGRK